MKPTGASQSSESQQLRNLGLTALFAGAIAIGFAPILVRWSDVGPSTTAGYRLLFALPLLWGWLRLDQAKRTSENQKPRTRRDFLQLGAAGLLFIGDLAIWHWSLRYTSVANSTLLTNGAPIFVTLGAWMFLGERITGGFLLGLAVALLGATLLLSASLELSRAHLWGDLLAILGAVFYGAYQLMVKHLRRRFSTATIMTWSGLVSCPGFFLLGVLSSENLVPGSGRVWLALAGLALLCHVGGQTLIAFAFGHLPVSFSSVSLLLQPLVSTMLAWILLSENIGPMQVLGGLVTLAGILLATRTLGRPSSSQHRIRP